MPSLEQNPPAAKIDIHQKVFRLIIGRGVVMILLIILSWTWETRLSQLRTAAFPKDFAIVIGIIALLSGLYLLMQRYWSNLSLQVRLQFFIDALLITWLIWRTGDAVSPTITLYIVLISISSIFLRPRATLGMSLVCVTLFLGLIIGIETGAITSLQPARDISRTLQIASFHVVALLVVGLLASRLSERLSSGDKLRETTETLANLKILHERIIESIRSGLITTDLEGTIYTFNKAAAEITGRDAAEMKGKTINSIFGNIDEQIEISTTSESEHPPRFEKDLITPDGFAVRIGFSVTKLISDGGELTGLIITFQDLTEIRSMEDSVRRKDRLAAVGRVAAGLAHEIRNPLGAMRGAIQVLESTMPPDSMQTDLMGIILRESDRLNNIITNFLTYARPKIGTLDETDVNENIVDTVTLIRHSPDVTSKHTITEKLPGHPVLIFADSTQLKQVFWNLARNALQAMPKGGDLCISLEELKSDRIKIVFEDTGKGMSAEQVENLFEPFTSSTTGGTGLGLSIVYQIIRDHNGTINVRSSEGEGTVITIELPRENYNKNVAKEDLNLDDSISPSRLKGLLNIKE